MTDLSHVYIWTVSGKKFHPFDPQPDEIDIGDIAHALSHQCRFTGHTRVFYSIAEHSLNVAAILPDELKLAGLLHDASEAYLSDISRPIKQTLPDYRELEYRIEAAIASKFGTLIRDQSVKDADLLTLKRECVHFFGVDRAREYFGELQNTRFPYGKRLGFPPIDAKLAFLNLYHDLTNP
jgi:uncharacterized protein